MKGSSFRDSLLPCPVKTIIPRCRQVESTLVPYCEAWFADELV